MVSVITRCSVVGGHVIPTRGDNQFCRRALSLMFCPQWSEHFLPEVYPTKPRETGSEDFWTAFQGVPVLFSDHVKAISLTECNSGTIQNCPFGVNTTIEFKYITTTIDNIGIWRCMFLLKSVPICVICLSSFIVLTPNDSWWIVPLLHSVYWNVSESDLANS